MNPRFRLPLVLASLLFIAFIIMLALLLRADYDSQEIASYLSSPLSCGGCLIAPRANCANRTLPECNLSGANLSNADFSDAHFTGTVLSNTRLAGAKFAHATFNKANLQNAMVDPTTDWTDVKVCDSVWLDGTRRDDGAGCAPGP